MKQLFFIAVLLFGFNSFSQVLTLKKTTVAELKLEKGKIYQNDIQIPSYKVKKIFASNLHSLHLYKQAKSKEAVKIFNDGLKNTTSIETNFNSNAFANQSEI